MRNYAGYITPFEGKYYARGPGGEVVQVPKSAYDAQQDQARMTRDMSAIDRFSTGMGRAFDEAASGARQLTYGDAGAEQQYRRQQAEAYEPMELYGGAAAPLGEFAGSMVSAAIPGKLITQAGIGGLQGAAENPDSPWIGSTMGVASTFLGDWAGRAIGRIFKRTKGTADSLRPIDSDWERMITRGEEAGLQFTPGQRSGRRGNIEYEQRLQRQSPTFANADEARRFANQQKFNEAAAATLGYGNRGRITPDMLREVVDSVGAKFDAIGKNLDAPVWVDGMRIDEALEEMGPKGQKAVLRILKQHGYEPGAEGLELDGKVFNGLRNQMAKASRSNENIITGVSDDLQGMMATVDDALLETNPYLADQITQARREWKALKIIEGSLTGSGAQGAAAGELTPAAAQRQLIRYDKGGYLRDRKGSSDPFQNMVRSLAATGEGGGRYAPSPKLGFFGTQMDKAITGPMARDYLESGDRLSRYLLGFGDEVSDIPGSGRVGYGVLRGLEGESDEINQLLMDGL